MWIKNFTWQKRSRLSRFSIKVDRNIAISIIPGLITRFFPLQEITLEWKYFSKHRENRSIFLEKPWSGSVYYYSVVTEVRCRAVTAPNYFNHRQSYRRIHLPQWIIISNYTRAALNRRHDYYSIATLRNAGRLNYWTHIRRDYWV